MQPSTPDFDDAITARWQVPDSEAWPFQACVEVPPVAAPMPSLAPSDGDSEDLLLRMRIEKANYLGLYGIAAAVTLLALELFLIVLG